jgi:hypothetical protein
LQNRGSGQDSKALQFLKVKILRAKGLMIQDTSELSELQQFSLAEATKNLWLKRKAL